MPESAKDADVVRVVWLHRDRVEADVDALSALLDTDERGRAAGYRRAADRDRFVLGAALLHLELARASGGDPYAAVVDRTCPGCARPHGAPRPYAPGWSASVTHSGAVVAVALRHGPPVGLDVEEAGDIDPDTMASVLSVAERDWVRGSRERFTRVWTGKEAVVKALGTGLSDLIHVELDPAVGVVRRLPDHAPRPITLTYRTLAPLGPGAECDPDMVAIATVGAVSRVELVECRCLVPPGLMPGRPQSHNIEQVGAQP